MDKMQIDNRSFQKSASVQLWMHTPWCCSSQFSPSCQFSQMLLEVQRLVQLCCSLQSSGTGTENLLDRKTAHNYQCV